jgi:hypothetical protein
MAARRSPGVAAFLLSGCLLCATAIGQELPLHFAHPVGLDDPADRR